MKRTSPPRWSPIVLSLGLSLGGAALAQQGGSASMGTPKSGTSGSGSSAAANATSPAALCGLTLSSKPTGGNVMSGMQGMSGTTSGSGSSASGGSATNGAAGKSGSASNSGGTSGSMNNTATGGANSPGASPTGGATNTGNSGSQTQARAGGTDICFAQQAALGDLFEIQSSRLVSAQAGNSKVKSFAQGLTQDHTKSTQQLNTVAARLKIQLPTTLDNVRNTQVAALRPLRGAAFDRAFMAAQVTAHEQAVNLFSAYRRSGANPDLRAHATRTLPALKKHLEMARDVLKTLAK